MTVFELAELDLSYSPLFAGLGPAPYCCKQSDQGSVKTCLHSRDRSLSSIIEVDIMIRIKRVHDPHEPDDGSRFLVDRLWPRGMKKENLQMDGWLKDVAPSDELRRWFGHDPAKWKEFCRRYDAELKANGEAWRTLLNRAQKQDITLLYSAHDKEHNNAVALRSFLEAQLYDGH
jgi:uncharacterized protein YeaO (DUF488 family)